MAQMGNIGEWIPRATTFLGEVRSELSRVTWPSLKETRAATMVVLVAVAIIAAFLGGVDALLAQIVQTVLR